MGMSMKGITPDQIRVARDGRVDVAAADWATAKRAIRTSADAPTINGGCNNMSSCDASDNFNCGNWGSCSGASNTGSCTTSNEER